MRMNRRRFLQSIALATCGLYLRLAPEAVRAVPAVAPSSPAPEPAVYDDCIRFSYLCGGYIYQGKQITAPEALALGTTRVPRTRPRINPRYFEWEAKSLDPEYGVIGFTGD